MCWKAIPLTGDYHPYFQFIVYPDVRNAPLYGSALLNTMHNNPIRFRSISMSLTSKHWRSPYLSFATILTCIIDSTLFCWRRTSKNSCTVILITPTELFNGHCFYTNQARHRKTNVMHYHLFPKHPCRRIEGTVATRDWGAVSNGNRKKFIILKSLKDICSD